MELNSKQKEIIILLKEKGELPTTKIAFLVSSNMYHVEPILEELEKDNLIISEKRNNATYWKLK